MQKPTHPAKTTTLNVLESQLKDVEAQIRRVVAHLKVYKEECPGSDLEIEADTALADLNQDKRDLKAAIKWVKGIIPPPSSKLVQVYTIHKRR